MPDVATVEHEAAAAPALLRSEDWLAVWLGALMIVLVLAGMPVLLPTFKWTTAEQFRAVATAQRPVAERLVSVAQARGEAAVGAAAAALAAALEAADRPAAARAARELARAGEGSGDAEAARQAADLAKAVRGPAEALAGKVFSGDNLGRSALIGLAYLVVAAIGVALMGGSAAAFAAGFPAIFLLAWLALFIAGNATVTYWGLEYVIWALALGLVVSNLIGVPGWLVPAVRTEYYIKTGLVILGAGILFPEILRAGGRGIVQALLVVLVVWYGCFWLARRLRVDDEFAVMLASAVSICGVSAAIAACGAIQGDRRKLSYVTSLVLIVAVPMMILQPWAARNLAIPDPVAGAWIGGTLDTSGSVVAAGALVSEVAMQTGVIVKFSQNVLIGVAAFALSVWWTFRQEKAGERPSAAVIWERFPKFVLGFLAVSFVFSFLLDPRTVAATKEALTGLRTLWFALAFVSIGLETRLGDLVRMEGGRPAAAFVAAQALNVVWTLVVAYLLFGGLLA